MAALNAIRRVRGLAGFIAVFGSCLANHGLALAADHYAFLVGVRQYDRTQLNDLQFTENDVTRLSSVLQQAGYPSTNIVLLTQSVGAANARFAPFARNIQKELGLVLREVKAGDSLLVAFSGHGVQFDDDNESYFCAADADLVQRTNLIPLGEIYRLLEASSAAAKVLLVDACRNDALSARGKSRSIVKLQTSAKQPDPPGGIAALFSCSRGEQSFEDPDLKHGIFFHFVIQGLTGKADFDKDREVSLTELEQYAVKEVQRYARIELAAPQTPERRGEVRGLLTVATLRRPGPAAQAPQAKSESASERRSNLLMAALRLVPTQDDVVFDRPIEAELHLYTISVEKIGQFPGHVVRDKHGQLMREFIDTNGDNVVDQWVYYLGGKEVYRDIDSDFDRKADRFVKQ